MTDSTPKSDQSRDNGASSPYHQKCVPPFYDAAQADRFVLAKLQREELEDKYIVLCDENLNIKRMMKDLKKQITRLSTQAQRQERIDKREGVIIPHCDEECVNNLQQQNRMLQAKVNVLTKQLQNHSRMHARVHGTANAREAALSPSRNQQELSPEKMIQPIQNINYKNSSEKDEIERLKFRITELEQELKRAHDSFERSIHQSELATPNQRNNVSVTDDVDRVMDNVEIIRLRRLNKRLAAQISALTDHVDAAEKELCISRKTIEQLNKENEDFVQRLHKEKQRFHSVQQEAAQNISSAQAVKALEEQVLDLQKERATLKDYNQKLLSLTSQQVTSESNPKQQEARNEITNSICISDQCCQTEEILRRNKRTSTTEMKLQPEVLEEHSHSIHTPEVKETKEVLLVEEIKQLIEPKYNFIELHDKAVGGSTSILFRDFGTNTVVEETKQLIEPKYNFIELHDKAVGGSTSIIFRDFGTNTVVEAIEQLVPSFQPTERMFEDVKENALTENIESNNRPLKNKCCKKKHSLICMQKRKKHESPAEHIDDEPAETETKEVLLVEEPKQLIEAKYNFIELHDKAVGGSTSIIFRDFGTNTVNQAIEQIVPSFQPTERTFEDVKENTVTENIESNDKRLKNKCCKKKHSLICMQKRKKHESPAEHIEDEPVETEIREKDELLDTGEAKQFVQPDPVVMLDKSVGDGTVTACRDIATNTVREEISQAVIEDNTKSSKNVSSKKKSLKKKHALICFRKPKRLKTIVQNEVTETDNNEQLNFSVLTNTMKQDKFGANSFPERNEQPLSNTSRNELKCKCNLLDPFDQLNVESKDLSIRNVMVEIPVHKSKIDNTKSLLITTRISVSSFRPRTESKRSVNKERLQINNCRNVVNGEDNFTLKDSPESCHEIDIVRSITKDPFEKSVKIIHSKETLVETPTATGHQSDSISSQSDKNNKSSFEICIISVKVDPNSFVKLMKYDTNPEIYIIWKFLGIEKSTQPFKPLKVMDFKNCVVYYGIISEPNLQNSCVHYVKTVCYLLRKDGSSVYLAEGELDISSTVINPGIMVYRYIDLIGNDIQIELYSSFRMLYAHQIQSKSYDQTFFITTLKENKSKQFSHTTYQTSYLYNSSQITPSKGVKHKDQPCSCSPCIYDNIVNHKYVADNDKVSYDSSSYEDNNLVVKIETLELNKNCKLLQDDNVTLLYIEYCFLGLKGQELETRSLPKDHVLNFNYFKNFTNEIKNSKHIRHKLRKLLQLDSGHVLQFLLLSEPSSDEQDVKECEELGFAEINLYRAMFLKKSNVIKEKLPVLSMDKQSKYGTLEVSVLGIKLMNDVCRRSNSEV